MLRIYVMPCLLGFNVVTRSGCFERHHGIYAEFSGVLWALLNTPDDYEIVLK